MNHGSRTRMFLTGADFGGRGLSNGCSGRPAAVQLSNDVLIVDVTGKDHRVTG